MAAMNQEIRHSATILLCYCTLGICKTSEKYLLDMRSVIHVPLDLFPATFSAPIHLARLQIFRANFHVKSPLDHSYPITNEIQTYG
jgi:hypothetical protein